MKNVYLLIALVGFSSVVMAADCSGNACGAAYVTKQRGCMVVINNSERNVRFSEGTEGYALLVYAQTTEVILTPEAAASKGTQCMTSIGKHTINFS